MTAPPAPTPVEFQDALDSIRAAHARPELRISETPAPQSLAPWAAAFTGDIAPHGHADSDEGTGRMLLLYDPSEPEAWGGRFRVVCFAQAPLENDIGVDPFLADVAWSWLIDALDSRGARYIAASGTATRILSTGYGELAREGDGSQIEIRASWTPLTSELGAHFEGWSELLCMLAGLPPHADGVVKLPEGCA